MKKCYSSKRYAIARAVNTVASLLSGGTLVLLGCMLQGEVFWRGILIILGVTIILYFALFVVFLAREYELNEFGIQIRYAGKYVISYPWDKFEMICVCNTHRSGAGLQDEVIWCSTRKLKRSPPAYGSVKNSLEYDFLHFKSLLTVEYSEDRLEEFRRFYKGCITDYR